jgi:ubiquitin C-terminal hydrolase
MNSTLQCIANSPGLTEFFTTDKYLRQINRTNPLGNKGRVADEYGALLKVSWRFFARLALLLLPLNRLLTVPHCFCLRP